MRATRRLLLTAARLSVELRDDGGLRYLDVRSLIDPGQLYLLPLPAPPRIDGLSLSTPLGRVHDICWSMVWGTGVPPAGCVVELSSETLRFRRTVTCVPQVLDGTCWIASAEGAFTTAATVVNGVETARVPLATRY